MPLMAPEPLTDETGMRKEVIRLERTIAIRDAEDKLRGEFSVETGKLRSEIKTVDVKVDALDAKVSQGFTDITRQIEQVLANQSAMKSAQDETSKKVAGVENLKIEVEENRDGFQIIKRFTTLGSSSKIVFDFVKESWHYLAAAYIGYHVLTSWLGSRGINWEMIFTKH